LAPAAKVVTDFGSGSDYGASVAVQADGKIVVAGSCVDNFDDFALARYNSNGNLDTGFGSGGKVLTDFASSSDLAKGVALQSDGKIVVAGESHSGTVTGDFALARYNANGTLDTSFDLDGKVTTDFASLVDRVWGVALQADGKILLVGQSQRGGTGHDFALARYNANGTLDATFNGDGKVTTDFPLSNDDFGYGVALQADGKIVVAGSSSLDFALARYNANGSLDVTFDSDGMVTTDFGADDEAYVVALQSDGKIVACGSSGVFVGTGYDFALARYLGDNQPPTINRDQASVSKFEGTPATNTGTFSDPQGNSTVTLTASVGTITQNNGAGTWSWSVPAIEGPAGPTSVTITATDSFGATATTTFTYTVLNVAPSNVSLGLSATLISENGSTTLSGSFADPGILDTHTITINWGDGSLNTVINIAAGVTSFSGISHQYLDDNPTGTSSDVYTISVTVADDDTGSVSGSTSVTVNNVAPTLTLNPVTAINENGVATPSGIILDPAAARVELIDFQSLAHAGSGVGPTFNTFSANGYTFRGFSGGLGSGGDSQALTSMGSNFPSAYPGSAALLNRFFSGTIQLTSDNGQPFNLLSLDISESNNEAGNANRTITFVGTKSNNTTVTKTITTDGTFGFQMISFTNFTDLVSVHWSSLSTHTDNVRLQSALTETFRLDINWGDPMSPNNSETFYLNGGSLPAHVSWNSATGEFSVTHQYRHDGASPGNGTASDLYPISVTVADDDGGQDTRGTSVTVNNVAPTVSITGAPATSPEGTAISLTSTVSDPGSADTHTYAWSVTKNGSAYASGTSSSFSFTPNDNGSYVVSLVVADDDSGVGSDSKTIAVTNVAPTASAGGPYSVPEGSTVPVSGIGSFDPVDPITGQRPLHGPRRARYSHRRLGLGQWSHLVRRRH
jgi:uncharacterized delta-60 repeat protein